MPSFKDLLRRRPQRRYFIDPVVGELVASPRTHDPSAWCCWEGTTLIEGRPEPTHIRISGDARAPATGLLRAVHEVVRQLPAIAVHVDRVLTARSVPGAFADFRLQSIVDWDHIDEILQLDFVPEAAPVLDESLRTYWPHDDWRLNHHLVLHARC